MSQLSNRAFAPALILIPVLALAALSAACGGGNAPADAGGTGGPPPMPVQVVTLEPRDLERTSEYVANLRSRSSTTIQPQVEGFVTRIAVRSGDRVQRGAVLFEIDAAPQQAALASTESLRAVRTAEVEYARQQADRMQALFTAGAVSQQELEQAQTALRTTEAQTQALDEQLREQRAQLGYFRVTAPTAGMVGDVPVRVGDRVTASTVLTTVSDNDRLEVYVSVPIQQAADLRTGLPVRIVDDRNEVVATNPVTFVSPTVEPTQTVLAKALLVDGEGRFRAEQLVRARIVWRSEPGLTIPLTSVTRINGQYFVFVAEAQGEGTVARQKPVALGDLVGNDYVVESGLEAGERLIVGGVQKIGDGAPVMIAPPAGAGPADAAAETKAS